MKKIASIAVTGALLALGVAQTSAQTTRHYTNAVLKANITATAYLQTGENAVTKKRITTKDVLKRIADQFGVTLGKKATLELWVIAASDDPNIPNGTITVRVRDGATVTNLSTLLGGPNVLNLYETREGSSVTQVKGKTSTDYTEDHISFEAGGVLLEGDGFATLSGTQSKKGIAAKASLSFGGTGHVDDENAAFDGKLKATGSGKANEVESIVTDVSQDRVGLEVGHR